MSRSDDRITVIATVDNDHPETEALAEQLRDEVEALANKPEYAALYPTVM